MNAQTMRYPQYAQSTSPEVLEAIRRNDEREADFRRRAWAFSLKHGGSGPYRFFRLYGTSLSGIASEEEPEDGRWKRVGTEHWAPYKSNPLSREFAAIAYRAEPVPGVPLMLHGPEDRDGIRMAGEATVFIHEGVAYSGTSLSPTDLVALPIPWEEIKASEFHAALEGYNASRKGDQA